VEQARHNPSLQFQRHPRSGVELMHGRWHVQLGSEGSPGVERVEGVVHMLHRPRVPQRLGACCDSPRTEHHGEGWPTPKAAGVFTHEATRLPESILHLATGHGCGGRACTVRRPSRGIKTQSSPFEKLLKQADADLALRKLSEGFDGMGFPTSGGIGWQIAPYGWRPSHRIGDQELGEKVRIAGGPV
jgi:hypothetical protein